MVEAVPALEAVSVSKSYGATVALQDVSITILPGEVHALLGENGAGKSTLVKLLSGVVRPNAGRMTIHGVAYQPDGIVDARRQGIATAFQELSLVPNLTVAQNLALPRQERGALGLVSSARTEAKASETLDAFGLALDPAQLVSDLTLAEKQRLEIVRAMSCNPKVLILDEPTAALAEVDWLFGLLRDIARRGTSILYISHRLAEVRMLCQRATVLRNGSSIGTVSLKEATDDDIFAMMVGHSRESGASATREAVDLASPMVLKLDRMVAGGIRDVSLELRKGEILGIAGLEGQGQRDLFRAVVGLQKITSGQINVDGAPRTITSPHRALKTGSGIAFVPEERKTEGIFTSLSTAANIALPMLSRISVLGGIWDALERRAAAANADFVDLNPRYLGFRIGELSGGNQQKALLLRAIDSGARTLLLYDPTRGVDVGTKEAIYGAIRDFAARGGAVLFYSSELPEITHLASRCLVLYGGRVQAEFSGENLVERKIVAAMTGYGSGNAEYKSKVA